MQQQQKNPKLQHWKRLFNRWSLLILKERRIELNYSEKKSTKTNILNEDTFIKKHYLIKFHRRFISGIKDINKN